VIADRDETERNIGRPRQRNIYLPENLQRPRPLDPGRFDQLLRNTLEGLPQQEDTERACEIRQRDCRDGIQQSELSDHAVIFDDQHVGHDHQL
jgi:hypothetical protein